MSTGTGVLTLITLVTTNKLPFEYTFFFMHAKLKSLALVMVAAMPKKEQHGAGGMVWPGRTEGLF